jgi:diacylglycerol kinase (ATP)
MMSRNALILYNPASGSAVDPDLWLGTLVHRLCEEGDYVVSVLPIKTNLSHRDIFASHGHIDVLIAAGGDGTVRLALQAVAEGQSQAPVGIIPLGTGNQLARNLSIYEENILADPLDDALAIILNGQSMPIDLGLMNGNYFCVAAGVGPISDAILLPEQKDKVNWKMLAYASSMIQTFALPPIVFKISLEGESFQIAASGIFVTNVSDLGVGTLSDTAELNDGLLDLCILNPTEFQDYLELGFRFAGGFVGGKAPYYIRKVTSLDIDILPVQSRLSAIQRVGYKFRSFFIGKDITPRPVLPDVTAMIDGDACGTTPMHIEVVPHVVNVLVPKQP